MLFGPLALSSQAVQYGVIASLTSYAKSETGVIIDLNPSHAFALAADQHAGHAVRGFARGDHGRVGSVPAGMINVVAGRTSLAVAALAAGCAMQDDFVRACCPVLVNIELRELRRGRGRLGDQSSFGGHLLEAAACVAPHGHQR